MLKEPEHHDHESSSKSEGYPSFRKTLAGIILLVAFALAVNALFSTLNFQSSNQPSQQPASQTLSTTPTVSVPVGWQDEQFWSRKFPLDFSTSSGEYLVLSLPDRQLEIISEQSLTQLGIPALNAKFAPDGSIFVITTDLRLLQLRNGNIREILPAKTVNAPLFLVLIRDYWLISNLWISRGEHPCH